MSAAPDSLTAAVMQAERLREALQAMAQMQEQHELERGIGNRDRRAREGTPGAGDRCAGWTDGPRD